MGSPMRAAASANLKPKQPPKKAGLWSEIKDLYAKFTQPIGYKPPAQQGARPAGPGRRQAEQIEEAEFGEEAIYGRRKPPEQPKSDYVNWPSTRGPAPPKFDREANDPRTIARKRREAKGEE